MVGTIREICIFMIIAQAVLLFVPGNVYVKYVRVLVGIMMIMGITGPVFGLFMDEGKKQEIRERAEELERKLSEQNSEFAVSDNGQEIYRKIEQELKGRLQECESGYEVLDVSLSEDRVTVILGEKQEVGEEREEIRIEPVTLGEEKDIRHPREEEKLKEAYGNRIGVEAEKMEIVLRQVRP